MGAVLGPLQWEEFRVLNYLDDMLICAQTEEQGHHQVAGRHHEAGGFLCLPGTFLHGGKGHLETVPAVLGANGSNGPDSSISPSLHTPSTEVPPQPGTAPTVAAAGQGAGHPQAASGPPLVGMPKKSRQGEASTDVSLVGWGTVHEGRGIGSHWGSRWASQHISVLQLNASVGISNSPYGNSCHTLKVAMCC